MELLDELEERLDQGPVYTARALGYPYSTYAQYKSGRRRLKPYLTNHIHAILALPDEQLRVCIEEAIARGR